MISCGSSSADMGPPEPSAVPSSRTATVTERIRLRRAFVPADYALGSLTTSSPQPAHRLPVLVSRSAGFGWVCGASRLRRRLSDRDREHLGRTRRSILESGVAMDRITGVPLADPTTDGC